MGGRSRGNHHIPKAVGLATSLGGRRARKYTVTIATIPPTYEGGGPTTVNEGSTALYTLTATNLFQATTLYYSVHPTTEFVEQNGSFSVTGGFGQFTLSAKPDGIIDGNVVVAVDFRTDSTSGTIVDTVSTTVVDQDANIDVGLHEFFDYGATWKYYDQNADPGAFTSTSYDDSSWSSGPGELGFGDGDEATTITKSSNNFSYAFRKTVNFPGGSQLDEIDYKILFDDGVVVYINGDEQIRSSNWTAGAISWGDLATSTISDNFVITGTIPASAWVDGDNVIAVQVSNNAGSSSDVSFNMGLTGEKLEPYIVSGPSTVNEGFTTTSYQLDTTQGDGTYYYSVHPTGEFVEQNGSFTVTSGTGTFTLSAAPDGVEDGDQLVAVDFRTDSTSGTIVGTVSTTVVDVDGGPIASWTSFQEGAGGYAGTTDTYVQSGANESTNRSAAASIVTDKNSQNERFALLKFDDLSAAFVDYTNVTVTSASLDLYINTEGQGMTLRTFLMDWADTDTWTSRNGDGLFAGGTGYMLSALGTWPGQNNFTGPITIDLNAQTVQDWINNPSANKGMFMIATHSSDGQQHDSSEGSTVSQRPKLHLAYTE